MKGRTGASGSIHKGKKIARSFFRKAANSRRRIEAMGKGALSGNIPEGIVVVPPKREA